MFFWKPSTAVNTGAVNPNGIEMLLANGWRTFFINGKPVFGNGSRSLPRISPDCTFLDSWFFDDFI